MPTVTTLSGEKKVRRRRLDLWTELAQQAREARHGYIGGCLECWHTVTSNDTYPRCTHCGGEMRWGHATVQPRTGRCHSCGHTKESREPEPSPRCECGGAMNWPTLRIEAVRA